MLMFIIDPIKTLKLIFHENLCIIHDKTIFYI